MENLSKVNPLNLTDIENMSEIEMLQRDHRGYSVLMVAAETGNINAVESLVARDEDVDLEVENQTAASLAFANKHFEIVLILLKANAKVPINYNAEESSEDLKAFVSLCNKMHLQVQNGQEEDLIENFTKNRNLTYFYSDKNDSLLKTSIVCKMFAIYELLLTHNIFLAPHEDMNNLNEKFSADEIKKLREINFKLSPDLVTEQMIILLRNCKFGPDSLKNRDDYIDYVRKAFEFLFKIPSLAIILKVVAAYRDFKIIFDFKRDSLTFLDPSAEPYTNGLFYVNGKIYIAAKDMFIADKILDVYSVIAHEFCHFAMFLVFENFARPYRKSDTQIKNDFSLITQECATQMDNQPIISSVFEYYDEEMFHAELIVRVPQMIVKYFKDEEYMQQMRSIYFGLFDFYESNVVQEMEGELPNLEKKFRPNKNIERRVTKLKRWNILLVLMLALSIIVAGFVAFYFYNPTLSWSKLNEKEKTKFLNSSIDYYGVEVKFKDIFANDSAVYNLLSSEQITFGLNGDKNALTKSIIASYNQFVFLSFINMTQSLKNKFITKNVNFQGIKVLIKSILRNLQSLSFLNVHQVKDVFDGNPVNISSGTERENNFFISRCFVKEEIDQAMIHFPNRSVNMNYPGVKTISDILNVSNESRIFLLSNDAGEGKSITLRNLAIKLKSNHPSTWVQFIDLKNYIKAFKIGNKTDLKNMDNLIDFMTLDLLKLNKLESQIFKELFNSSRVVFFWDGFDEVSPIYTKFMIDLTGAIRQMSQCFQFFSTRPLYSKLIRKSHHIEAYKLVSLGISERLEFLVKFIASENFKLDVEKSWIDYKNNNLSYKIKSVITKAKEILKSVEASNIKERLLTNPLLLRIISEIASDEGISIKSELNFYSIFDLFIGKKLNAIFDKGEEAKNDIIKFLQGTEVTIMKVHQAYALKYMFQNYIETYLSSYGNVTDLMIMESISKRVYDYGQISRLGIMTINSEEDFRFVHQTFAEFLVARFINETIDKLDFKSFCNDSTLKAALLTTILYSGKFEVIRSFLQSYMRNFEIPSGLFKYLQETETLRNVTQNEEVLKFFSYARVHDFFRAQHSFDTREMMDKLDIKPYNWNLTDYNEFIEKLEGFKNKTGSQTFFTAMMTRTKYNRTIAHQIAESNYDGVFPKFLGKINLTLNKSEITSLMLTQNLANQTSFMIAAWSRKLNEVKYFWKFLSYNLNETDLKRLLCLEHHDLWTALQFSTWNLDFRVFLFMKGIYETKFSIHKIQGILSRINSFTLPFIQKTIKEGSFETSNELSFYLEKIFSDQKLKLRKILLSHNEIGDSIFTIFSTNAYENKIKIFKELLEKTFNDKDLYENYLKHYTTLKIPANENFTHLNEWFDINFDIFLANTQKLSHNEMRSLLLSKNSQNERNLLHDLMKNSFNPENLKFLELLKSKLNFTEIAKLVMAKDKDFNSPIIFAAKYQTSFAFQYFWNFTKSILDLENQKELLTDLNNENKTVFEISAMYIADFNEVLTIYEKCFSLDEMKNILINFEVKIIAIIKDLMLYNSFDSCQSFAKFLGKIFDRNETLQNLLSLRNEQGETIFNIPADSKKVSPFIQLYSRTFSNQDDFNKSYSQLKVPLMFQEVLISNRGRSFHSPSDFKILRSSRWNLFEFKYFIENYSKVTRGVENTKNFLFGRGIDGNSLLHEMPLNNDEENFEAFLLLLEKNLGKSKIFNFLELQNNDQQNSIMLVAKLNSIKNVKVLLSFMKKHLRNNETENLLKATDKNKWTVLQYSFLNKKSECFELIRKIFLDNFKTKEIEAILLRPESLKKFFLFDMVKFSNLDMVRNVASFLEKLFEFDKNNLRQLLVTTNNLNETIFAHKSEKICILENTLRSTFNDSQSFSIYLSSLRSQNFYNKFFENGSKQVRKEFTSDMFYDLINNYDQYEENMKEILLSKNANGEAILHELAVYGNKDYLKPFLDHVKDKKVGKLNRSEMLTLFLTKAGVWSEISLMRNVRLRAYDEWKYLWIFIEQNLDYDAIQKILLTEQKYNWTSLQYSMFNQKSGSFIAMKNIYENYFTKEKIQEILLKTSKNYTSFLNTVIEDASVETLSEAVHYLSSLFKNNKSGLVEILSHRDTKRETVFSKFCKKKPCLGKIEILEKLLRNFVDNKNEVDLLLSSLKLI